MRDLANNIHLARAISPAVAGAADSPLVSEIIDRRGYDSLVFAILAGSLADANATFAVLVEDGDESDLSDAAAVADEELNGTEALAALTFADDNEPRKIGYVGSKRYVRLTVTPSGNTGDVYLSAIAVLGHPELRPTANPPA